MTVDDEMNRQHLRQLVVQAAIDYVDYFFPREETGVGLAGTGGQLVRAVRKLQRWTNDGNGPVEGDS